MTAMRPDLTPEHRTMLRDFVRLVYEMDQCRFVQQFRRQDHTISCGLTETKAPEYDWDDFRSFMTIFRKVGIAENEPTHLAKIYKMIGRYASDAFRARLAADRSQVMAMIYGTWTGMQVGHTVDGEDVMFTIADLLDMITNGMIFHEDPRHRQAIEMFAKGERWTYLWPTLHFKIIPIKNAAVMLFRYILQDGILTEVNYPQAWQEARRAWQAANNPEAR